MRPHKPSLLEQALAKLQQQNGQAGKPPAAPQASTRDPLDQVEIAAPPWPTLPQDALLGLPGEVVRSLAPYTEADPAGLLVQFLAAFGNAADRSPRFLVEGTPHHANLFVALVGNTSSGRKGTSRGRILQILNLADPFWVKECQLSGLGSGEVLVSEAARRAGQLADEPVESPDHRLLIVEAELARLLKVMTRESCTLSAILRDAWDTGSVQALSRSAPVCCQDAHLSILGHITQHELQRSLKSGEVHNGFANRFLWVLVRRSQLLPEGGEQFDPAAIGFRVSQALNRARLVGEMRRSESARRLWHEVYAELTADRPGLFGVATSRAEAQALRLSMVYALTEGSAVIDEPHLRAALAVWRYCEQSARLLFGDRPDDPLQAKVLDLLELAGSFGLTRTEISHSLGRNLDSGSIARALAGLRAAGLARAERGETEGRPVERWYFVLRATN